VTPEQHAERRSRIGGSDANKIVNGGEWHQLWLEKTGRVEPEDLSWVLPVQIGLVTEPLNLAFFEHATGHSVFARGQVYIHPRYAFVGCTLDGLTMIENRPAIVQCKHVNPFAKIEEIEARYYPQCAHEMLCTGASRAFLSVIIGTQKHEIVEIHRDADYTARLLELETEFWGYVERDEPPPQPEPLATPKKPETFRTVDMSESNLWASLAADWLSNAAASRICDKAAKELRAMIEPDVGHAYGHGIEIRRAKDGRALFLREEKA
jgi:predicted phage-related endonuclease